MDYSGYSYGSVKGSGGAVVRGGSVPRSVTKFQERESPSPRGTIPSGSTPSPTHVAGRTMVMRDYPKSTLEDDIAATNAALQYNALVHASGLDPSKQAHWQTAYAMNGYGASPHGLVDASVPKRSHWQTTYTVDGYGVPHMDRIGAIHGAVTEESSPAVASAVYNHYGIKPGDEKGYITSGNSFYHTATPSQAYLQAVGGKPMMQARQNYQNLYKAQGYAPAALYPAGYAESLALASGTLEGYDAQAAYNAYASAVNGAIPKSHLQGSARPTGDERYGSAGYGGIPTYTQSRETYHGVASTYATPRRVGGGGSATRRF